VDPIFWLPLRNGRKGKMMIYTKEVKKSQEFSTLEMKVLALKEQNKTDEQMSVADLRLMMLW
jgi:hypothetical protein